MINSDDFITVKPSKRVKLLKQFSLTLIGDNYSCDLIFNKGTIFNFWKRNGKYCISRNNMTISIPKSDLNFFALLKD